MSFRGSHSPSTKGGPVGPTTPSIYSKKTVTTTPYDRGQCESVGSSASAENSSRSGGG